MPEPGDPATASPPVLLGALFALSGAAGLLAEQVFEKSLSTVVGGSTAASAVVLAVFFGGLTAGALGYGVLRSRLRRPILAYAGLEAAVGMWALLLGVGFSPLLALGSVWVAGAGTDPGTVFLHRLLLAVAWILPPSLFMGATFPAVVGVLEQLGQRDPRGAATRLYALNLLGAVAAAALAPYLLLPRFGLRGALFAAAAIDLLVALLARRMGRGLAPLPEATPSGAAPGGRPALRLLGLALGSGFLFFGFEVIWVHLIGAVLGNSVYAFSNMLLVVLSSLFVAGLVAGRINAGSAPQPAWVLPLSLAAAAVLLAVMLGAWDDVPRWIAVYGQGTTSFGRGELLRLCLAAVAIAPAAVPLGLTYPLLFRHRSFPAEGADRAAAWVAAANALGCILGALSMGFGLLPALGSLASYRLLAFSAGLLAFVLALLEWLGGRGQRQLALIGVMLLALLSLNLAASSPGWNILWLTSGWHVYFRPGHVLPGSRLLFVAEDTAGGFTTVIERPDPVQAFRVLLTNGKFQGSDSGEMAAQVAFAIIPVACTAGRDRALVIGLGTGETAHVVSASGFRSVDVAELSPGIEAAARYFAHINGSVLERPGVHLHIEDGRNFLLRADRPYDLITIELTSVWFAGASNLYSREFYALARSRLTGAGVLQQWIQLHHIAPEEVVSVVATMRSVFDHVALWTMGGQGVVLGSAAPLTPETSWLAGLAADPVLRPLIEPARDAGNGEAALRRLGARKILDSAAVDRLAADRLRLGVPLNDDANRYLEYATPRHNLSPHPDENDVLALLQRYAAGP